MIRTVGILLLVGAVFGFEAEPTDFNGRIVGGYDTDIFHYPYQVSVLRNGRHICGGSIIAENFILTAAHCILTGSYSIRVGSTLINEGGEVYDVHHIISHEKYSSLLSDYDGALLHLETPLVYSEAVQPIGLADAGEELPSGTAAVVTGWGTLEEGGSASEILQEVEVPLLTNSECKKFYPLMITSRMICAGYTSGAHDACQGDSGGPLVANGKQVGIVSWGRGCARRYAPGVYARVAALREWIDENTGSSHHHQ